MQFGVLRSDYAEIEPLKCGHLDASVMQVGWSLMGNLQASDRAHEKNRNQEENIQANLLFEWRPDRAWKIAGGRGHG